MDESAKGKKNYQKLVDQSTPNSAIGMNCVKAFVIGGLICVIGQFILNFAVKRGFTKDEAALITSIVLIFASAVLTGFGLYAKFGKFSGAGTIVPITGFANSVVSPAIEYRKNGLIFGLGAQMFVVAGPVIVYGTLTSFIVGIVYYFVR